MKSSSKKFPSNYTIAGCFAIVFLLFAQSISACSWDYNIWQNRHKYSDPYYRFIKNRKAGFIDKTGKVVIEPKAYLSGNYQDGVINGLLNLGRDGYIDIKTGKEVSEELYLQKTEIKKKLSLKMFWDGSVGFVNFEGDTVIPEKNTSLDPKFAFAKDFNEGFAPVVVDGPCFYHDPQAVCSDTDVFPIGTRTQTTTACQFNFINEKGDFISSETFLDVREFSEGLAPVKTADGWGYINEKGKMAIKPQFEEASPFSEGFGLVKSNGLFGYIDQSGTFIIKPQFNSANSFKDNLASVGNYSGTTIDNEFYYINKTGKFAFPDKFLLASDYFKGIAHVLVSEITRTEIKDGEELEIRTRTFAYINEKGKKMFVYSVEDEM